MKKKLPKNWVECTLGEIAEWGSGGTPSRGVSEYYNGTIPWLKTGDLNDDIITVVNEYITELGLKNSSAKVFPKGSVVIAMYGATIGKTGILDFDSSTNQACAVAIPYFNMNKFLFLLLKSEKENFIEKGKGGAQPNISQAVIKSHKFLLPPLAEQNRIVAKLDVLFAQLETIKSSMVNIPLLLKDFRQQILTQAVTGKLTDAWRNENNSKDWKLTKVGKFMKEVKDKIDPTIIDEVPYIGLEHIRKDGGIIAIGISSNLKSNKTVFKKNDVIYGKLRPYLNKHDVVKFDGICSTDILVYRNDNINSCIFFNYFLGNSTIIEKLNGEAKGINLPRVSASIVNNLDIKIPSLEEQKEIVYRVENLFDKANAIELEYKILKERINYLPQALLHKAFKGELTEQLDSDKDARELLKEINALKNHTILKKKKV
jgi:type I restriction enzyme S subunit